MFEQQASTLSSPSLVSSVAPPVGVWDHRQPRAASPHPQHRVDRPAAAIIAPTTAKKLLAFPGVAVLAAVS